MYPTSTTMKEKKTKQKQTNKQKTWLTPVILSTQAAEIRRMAV
jgi:hypothetical protein